MRIISQSLQIYACPDPELCYDVYQRGETPKTTKKVKIMAYIQAQNLQVGNQVKDWGDVEEVTIYGEDVEVTFKTIDPECGDVEFLPCTVSLGELFYLEIV